MNKFRKICVVTGTRAEYGLLRWVMEGIRNSTELKLQVIATGMHLSPEFGLTYREIEKDGFYIDRKVEMLLSSDTSVGIAKSIGIGMVGFADAIKELNPDLLVVLGDRYELISICVTAMVSSLPIAHIGGGDYGEGTYDNITRHCITKMSHLHFVTHEDARKTVLQLGEPSRCVFNVGSLAIDSLKNIKILKKEEISRKIDELRLNSKWIVASYHPLSYESFDFIHELKSMLEALAELGEEYDVLFTMPNSDNKNRLVTDLIKNTQRETINIHLKENLGTQLYLSLIANSEFAIGNSSSGLYEVPLLQKPTIDIGLRQKGRARGNSVFSPKSKKEDILSVISQIFMGVNVDYENYPYGDQLAAPKIVQKIKNFSPSGDLINKKFRRLG